MSTTAVWLRRLAPVALPWVRLVCFPHSGGHAGFFRAWREYLPGDVDLYAAQYPGRWDRIADPPAGDVDELAGELARAVTPLLHRPTAFFGHSLGATIAFEVARRLTGQPRVAHLFASGDMPPHHPRTGTLHRAGDDALWAEMGRLGGTRPEVLANAELRASLLPVLRGDYRLAETYRLRDGPPLDCPVTVLVGDEDSECGPEVARGWRRHTRAAFAMRTFVGGHFYLSTQVPEVVGEVVRQLAGHVPGRYPDAGSP